METQDDPLDSRKDRQHWVYIKRDGFFLSLRPRNPVNTPTETASQFPSWKNGIIIRWVDKITDGATSFHRKKIQGKLLAIKILCGNTGTYELVPTSFHAKEEHGPRNPSAQ